MKERFTDVGNGCRLAERFKKEIKYVPSWGWLVWKGTHWARDKTGHVVRCAKQIVDDMFRQAQQLKKGHPELAKALEKHARRSESCAKIEAMIKLAKSEAELVVTPEQFDTNPFLFNCLNGTLNLRTGRRRKHRPEDMITRIALVNYDPKAECPRWEKFLHRIMNGNKELISYLQRVFGCSLSAEVIEQILIIFWGLGENGKTVLIETFLDLLGTYAAQTPTETLMIRPVGSIPNDLARLVGVRLVVATETERSRRLAESRVKQMTGGDTITARFLHKEFFQFKPSFQLILSCNHKPVIEGDDHAIWRRIRLVPFRAVISKDERDKRLAEKLRGEWPGILRWAVKGYLEWQRIGGLAEPQEIIEATKAYRLEMDQLGQFMEDRCVQGPGLQISSSALFEAYRRWCTRQGVRADSRTGFGRAMGRRGFGKGKDSKKRRVVYLGLTLGQGGQDADQSEASTSSV